MTPLPSPKAAATYPVMEGTRDLYKASLPKPGDTTAHVLGRVQVWKPPRHMLTEVTQWRGRNHLHSQENVTPGREICS